MRPRICIAVLVVLAGLRAQDSRPVGPQAGGAVIVPTHQMLRPAGHQVTPPGEPTDLLLLLLDRGRTLADKGKNDLILISTADRVIRQSRARP